jgi:hypothetical protein
VSPDKENQCIACAKSRFKRQQSTSCSEISDFSNTGMVVVTKQGTPAGQDLSNKAPFSNIGGDHNILIFYISKLD